MFVHDLQEVMQHRFKSSTNKNYLYGWKKLQLFLAHCSPGHPPPSQFWCPISEPNRDHAWAAFFLWLRRKSPSGAGISYETARKCLPAISAQLQAMGQPDIDFASMPLLTNVRKAWKLSSVPGACKTNVSQSDLNHLISKSSSSHPIFLAISIFCWYSLARLGEALSNIYTTDCEELADHTRIFLQNSKRGHHRYGAFLSLPSAAWQMILSLLKKTHRPRKTGLQPARLFPIISRQKFTTWLKTALPRKTGHSFRRGGAQFLFDNGIPIPVIKRIGRWRSNAWRIYISTTQHDAKAHAAVYKYTEGNKLPSVNLSVYLSAP